jgi:glycine cleavage system H protein
MSTQVPEGRKYTKDHEWAAFGDGKVRVGITAFAVEQLGDITLVTLDVKVGAVLESGKAFGTIESVKTLSDLYAPVTGKVVAVNETLRQSPEVVNEDCYGKAWMIEIESADTGAALMDARAYEDFVKAST